MTICFTKKLLQFFIKRPRKNIIERFQLLGCVAHYPVLWWAAHYHVVMGFYYPVLWWAAMLLTVVVGCPLTSVVMGCPLPSVVVGCKLPSMVVGYPLSSVVMGPLPSRDQNTNTFVIREQIHQNNTGKYKLDNKNLNVSFEE